MRGFVVFGLVIAVAAGAASSGSARERGPARLDADRPAAPTTSARATPVVSSLEPAETAKLWRSLVEKRSLRSAAPGDCRPLRAVFYAATDWLRLATNLAENMSTCAQYYISIPPLVADKTQPRPNQAWRIRALGPNFHPMAEINFGTWTKWVQSTGSSWYVAGTTARQRMAAAGYDVALGDTWALNEISSAVRRGTGVARANIREFLRGLYEGDGTHPTQGAVFVIGVGQRTTDVSLYQTNLQNWFYDSEFWSDMTKYVSDWSQEVYGDVRSWAVPGAAAQVRRDYLNDYLQHELVLSQVGPQDIGTARSYLQTAFSPLANAAWERESGYGWTMVPSDQMAAYVSAQVAALRFFSATTKQPLDHWGFAWAPRNGSGMTTSEFNDQTDSVVRRLAAAIHDSGEAPTTTDPGSGACGPPGQNLYCAGDLDGAKPAEAWKSFRGWTQPVLAFATPAPTVPAGAPSAAMSLKLVTSTGLAITTPTPLAVTLSSDSTQGTFSTSPAGPWSNTLSVTIPPGKGTSPSFYYQDTLAGGHVLTASAAGATGGSQAVTISSGQVVTLSVTPSSATVPARASQAFIAVGTDAYGNSVPVSASWSVSPTTLGAVAPSVGSTTMFTAGRTPGSGTVVASVATPTGSVSATAQITVTPAPLRIGSIRYEATRRSVLVRVAAVDASGRPVSRAVVSVVVHRKSRRLFSARKVTGPAGGTVYRVQTRLGGCFTTTVRRVSATGFRWDGRTPYNRFCRTNSP